MGLVFACSVSHPVFSSHCWAAPTNSAAASHSSRPRRVLGKVSHVVMPVASCISRAKEGGVPPKGDMLWDVKAE